MTIDGSKRRLEFFTVRYVPDRLKAEFVNLGIVIFAPTKTVEFCAVHFIENWSRVEALDADADIPALRSLVGNLTKNLRRRSTRVQTLRLIQESFSNTLQLSEKQTCVTSNYKRDILSKYL